MVFPTGDPIIYCQLIHACSNLQNLSDLLFSLWPPPWPPCPRPLQADTSPGCQLPGPKDSGFQRLINTNSLVTHFSSSCLREWKYKAGTFKKLKKKKKKKKRACFHALCLHCAGMADNLIWECYPCDGGGGRGNPNTPDCVRRWWYVVRMVNELHELQTPFLGTKTHVERSDSKETFPLSLTEVLSLPWFNVFMLQRAWRHNHCRIWTFTATSRLHYAFPRLRVNEKSFF